MAWQPQADNLVAALIEFLSQSSDAVKGFRHTMQQKKSLRVENLL
jgi:hypothetical protein